ncbi:MAG: histidine phosphatase family protein [Bacteroidota bacterium]
MKLHLIRHLPTEWNQRGILQGSRDIPILPPSAAMRARIAANQERIRDLAFDHILTSELQRTQQSAAAYDIHNFRVEPLLNELNFGPYEGRPKAEMIEELGAAWRERPRSITLGEAIVDFEARLLRFIEQYRSAETVLAFAHGRLMRALCSIAATGDVGRMNDYQIANNELLVLTFEAG